MNIKWLRWVLPFCYCLLLSPFYLHSAQTSLLPQNKPVEQATSKEPVVAKLISDETSIQPGHPFWVGVELKMEEGWDTYWINPGDSGFPTKVEWILPEGFTASSIQWPYPERFVTQSFVGYGYTHSVVLLAEITPPADLKDKTLSIKANVSWLACKEQCVPGNAKLELSLPVNLETPQKNDEMATLFTSTKMHVPKSLTSEEGTLTIGAKGKEIILDFKPSPGAFKDVVDALFIPETNEIIDHGAPQQLRKAQEGDYILALKRAHPEQAPPQKVKGVLLVSEKGVEVKKAIAVDSPLTIAKEVHHTLSLKMALLFAFVGGMILNVMPCVLPVIALKIFSFVKMGQDKRELILKHGGVFAFGVLVSFWVLSGLLLILRATGESIGWGFQLQDPVFVTVLVVVLFLLALSLFGVFEIGTSLISVGQNGNNQTTPLKNSFMSGVLATIVATPCTGPLLGPAVGFAMTMPPLLALSIFTMVGLGMASPYLLFSAYPKLVRFLPKPGNWMIAFKQLMGFIMMATCLWLIWVLSAQTSSLVTFVLLGALLVIGIAGWIYGHFATPIRKKITRRIATLIACILLGCSGFFAIHTAKAQSAVTKTVTETSATSWIPYSPEKVEAFRKEGKPVFVDFTAKWCLICQANKVTLQSKEMEKAFEEKGVVTMVADWTKRDPMITETLQKMGRSGVPVYVLYPADPSKPPCILPQTLTKSIVTTYLNDL